MKAKKRRQPKREPKATGGARSKDRRIVVIDQGPIRRETATACQVEMKKLDKARNEWRVFEQEDKPAFTRWMAATFGALMSSLRTNADQIRQKETLIEEVEQEMFINGWSSYRRAYSELKRRRERAERAMEFEDSAAGERVHFGAEEKGEKTSPEGKQEVPKDARKALFEEMLEGILGMDPEMLSKREYDRMFREFERAFFGSEDRGAAKADNGSSAPPKSGHARLKELYRILVRRLHPDTRADSDPGVSAVWHEVQQAYADGNVERLEMLLAMTDIQTESTGDHTTLSQMRAVLAEIRTALRALKRSLGSARKELAWNFRNADLSKLEARLRKQMEADFKRQELQITELEEFIATFAESPNKRRKRARKRGQQEFWA